MRQIGLRSVDEGEKRLVHEQGVEVFDMRYIDEIGMRARDGAGPGRCSTRTPTCTSASTWTSSTPTRSPPASAPPCAGGPTYREAQLCMEMIADTGRLASLDIVELNPALDVRNMTATLAVDLVESLFGKSTLMRCRARHSSRALRAGFSLL
jgi:arginase